MQTFRTTIKLFDADRDDYKKLVSELESQSKKMNQRINVLETMLCEGIKTDWEGDVSIQKIARTIFLAYS